ncbi:MAG: acetyl-CoA hydrolase/transferase family protein [Desulfobacterales bacterium]|nr:acetyl-CoA hydrolase/transferase family protein [Desulfobacterales bacterium]MCP4159079.1 acetyl-CoA hydrolase/transferase family protein [Deltaproteobacteria bacterium]
MNIDKKFKEKCINIEEAAKLIKSGDTIVSGHACASPEPVLDEIAKRADELSNVKIVHVLSFGKLEYCKPELEKSFHHISLFGTKNSRDAINKGRSDFISCFFNEVPELFRDKSIPVDVAIISVSLPDEDGNCSLGLSVDYTYEAAMSAKVVIAEVSPHMPRTMGSYSINIDKIDHLIPSNRKMIEVSRPVIGDVEKKIGYNAAGLIKDEDCLQIGIGAIPEAVLSFLDDKKDLSIHSEMISDGVMDLVEKGVINSSKKTLHPSKIVLTFAMGTEKFYQWMDNNPMIEMYPVDYINDPFIIAQNDNLVSINSAISVDLLGQVSADSIGPYQYSGVGGQVDFVRGAKRSKGGRSIIALPATAAKGTCSRIVAALDRGQSVTTSRNDVDYIVTEYGVASLHGKTIKERARQLINIAAPEYRENLEKEFHELYFK